MTDSLSGKKNLINDSYTDLLPSKSNKVCEVQNAEKVFVVIDYDELSIETIYSANLGNDITSGAGENMVTDEEGHSYIEYVADFKLVVKKVTSQRTSLHTTSCGYLFNNPLFDVAGLLAEVHAYLDE